MVPVSSSVTDPLSIPKAIQKCLVHRWSPLIVLVWMLKHATLFPTRVLRTTVVHSQRAQGETSLNNWAKCTPHAYKKLASELGGQPSLQRRWWWWWWHGGWLMRNWTVAMPASDGPVPADMATRNNSATSIWHQWPNLLFTRPQPPSSSIPHHGGSVGGHFVDRNDAYQSRSLFTEACAIERVRPERASNVLRRNWQSSRISAPSAKSGGRRETGVSRDHTYDWAMDIAFWRAVRFTTVEWFVFITSLDLFTIWRRKTL